jgi:hypothetical protein
VQMEEDPEEEEDPESEEAEEEEFSELLRAISRGPNPELVDWDKVMVRRPLEAVW